jgi:hypothetical protein
MADDSEWWPLKWDDYPAMANTPPYRRADIRIDPQHTMQIYDDTPPPPEGRYSIYHPNETRYFDNIVDVRCYLLNLLSEETNVST